MVIVGHLPFLQVVQGSGFAPDDSWQPSYTACLISPPVAKPVWGLGGSSPPTSKNFMEIRERKEGEEEKKEIGEKRG